MSGTDGHWALCDPYLAAEIAGCLLVRMSRLRGTWGTYMIAVPGGRLLVVDLQ